MRNLPQLTTRRTQLYILLDEAEAVLHCTGQPKYARNAAKSACVALSTAIEQIEWVMGLREVTSVDALLGSNLGDFSAN